MSILLGAFVIGWPNILGYLACLLARCHCVLFFYPMNLSIMEDCNGRDSTINWNPIKNPDIYSDCTNLGPMPTAKPERWNAMVSLISASPKHHGSTNLY